MVRLTLILAVLAVAATYAGTVYEGLQSVATTLASLPGVAG